jgi:uncharacterized membrane protein
MSNALGRREVPAGAVCHPRFSDPQGGSESPAAADPGDGRAPMPDRPGTREGGSLGGVRRFGLLAIGIQFGVMLAFSTLQYRRFAVGQDFAAYTQAWWKIAHLHLNPWSSVFTTSFWRNDGELAMWPLAILYRLYPHPVDLLWLQDAVVAITEVVAFCWVLEILSRSGSRVSERNRSMLAAATVAVLVLNPWCYETVAYDFHFEVLVALFAVLIGRDLWAGRVTRLWLWVPLALLSHDLAGGLCVLGIGLSGILAGQSTRRIGYLLCAVGLAWLALTTSIGAAGIDGRLTVAGYGYLVGGHVHSLSLLSVAGGIIHHPAAVGHMLAARWALVVALLASVGLIGILSPWGFGIGLVVLTPCVLNSNPAFLFLSFQNWPLLPFVMVGSVMILLRLLGSSNRVGVLHLKASALTLAGLSVLITAVMGLPAILRAWIPVDAQTAAVLARVESKIPPGAEVIASNGIVGGFAERDWVYPFPFSYHPSDGSPTAWPIKSASVVFVLLYEGRANASSDYTNAAVGFIEHNLGARVIEAGNGVYVLELSPPPSMSEIVIPATR